MFEGLTITIIFSSLKECLNSYLPIALLYCDQLCDKILTGKLEGYNEILMKD